MAAQQIKRLADEHHLERIFIASDMTQQEFEVTQPVLFFAVAAKQG
jgi:hypothetical protein